MRNGANPTAIESRGYHCLPTLPYSQIALIRLVTDLIFDVQYSDLPLSPKNEYKTTTNVNEVVATVAKMMISTE